MCEYGKTMKANKILTAPLDASRLFIAATAILSAGLAAMAETTAFAESAAITRETTASREADGNASAWPCRTTW